MGDFHSEFHVQYIAVLLFCLFFMLSIYYFNQGKKLFPSV